MMWRAIQIDIRGAEDWVATPEELVGDWRVLARVDDDAIVARGTTLARLRVSREPRWQRVCHQAPNAAYVSLDRLLVTTSSLSYHAWGFLGAALLFDIDSGSSLAELRGERAASLGDGRFVLGLEGYDVFHTWLHGRDGALLQQWRSCGDYVVDPDGTIRVVERDRCIPTRSRVVRLLPGGDIERGPPLHGAVSQPIVLDDGTILFVDGGALRAVGRDLSDATLAELLPIAPHDLWRFSSSLALRGNALLVEISSRPEDAANLDTTHRWHVTLARGGS